VNILMMTNTYKPILGGLERSIESFTREFRRRGHRVVIVAPEYEGAKPEKDVVRIPAVQNFNGSDFSVQLPIPGILELALGDFRPDLVHSHHPFLVGDTALRVASKYNVPLVFTHHTLYEENTHYVPGNEEAVKRFVIELSTGYANMVDQVFAPSESIKAMLEARGVTTPVVAVPTGIYISQFSRGAGQAFRKKLNIPADAFVVGHVGRLAPEKNLEFMTQAVAQFLRAQPKAHFLVAGDGPSQENMQEIFNNNGVSSRAHFAGVLKGKDLVDIYHAMDIFVFASHSETQGLVLAEAMACGTPVVAVDAPGVREVVKDKANGRLIETDNVSELADAMEWVRRQPAHAFKQMRSACRETASEFSMERSVGKALAAYASLSIQGFFYRSGGTSMRERIGRVVSTQWGLFKNFTKAVGAMTGLGDGNRK